MIEALETLVKTCKVWSEGQKTQVLAWLECARDFGTDNDKLVRENEELQSPSSVSGSFRKGGKL